MKHDHGSPQYVDSRLATNYEDELHEQQRRSNVMGAVAALVLIVLLLACGLYAVLAPVMTPRATMAPVQSKTQPTSERTLR